MRDYSVSVAMAAYNGEKYIEEQLRSILACLQPADEVIVSDDGSADKTREIVKSIGDRRVILIDGPQNGIKKNFENAISNCGGRYIFLSDQDDVWEPGKVDRVLEVFEKEKAAVVVHDAVITDADLKTIGESVFAERNSGPGAFKNLVKNSYVGCCMAFDAALKDAILPIPQDVDMHDAWIGLAGDRLGHNVFISDKLIKYRRHDSNSSDLFNHYGFFKMVRKRLVFVKRLTERGL